VVRLGPLITHVLPLGDVGKALDMLAGGTPGCMKIILEN